jgi:hypothetical protein
MMNWPIERAISCVVTSVGVLLRHSLASHRFAADTEARCGHRARNGGEPSGLVTRAECQR